MSAIIVCPFCLTIFMRDAEEGETCPECEVGELLDYDEYKLRLSSSFMDYIAKERGTDDI